MAPPVRLVETRRAAYQQCIEDVRNLAQVRGALLAPDRSDEYAERGRALNDAALAWESKVRLLTNNQRTVSACHDFVFSARDSWPPSAAWSPSTLLGPKEIQPTPDLSRGGLND